MGERCLVGHGCLAKCCQWVTSGTTASVRLHAASHSRLVMCVAGSQNAIQSFKVRPPPPAVLGASSVGLLLPGVGEASVSDLAGPPLPSGVVVIWGDSGAMPVTVDAGAAMAAGGVVVVAVLGAAGPFRGKGRLSGPRDVVPFELLLWAMLVAVATTSAKTAANPAITMCLIMLASFGGP
jgi:hypothetical protein